MSTDYEIHCLTCRANGRQWPVFTKDNWRDPKEVQWLIEQRQHFAAIGKSIPVNFSPDGWDAWGSMFPWTFEFFAEHEGHELAVFDEYGDRWEPK